MAEHRYVHGLNETRQQGLFGKSIYRRARDTAARCAMRYDLLMLIIYIQINFLLSLEKPSLETILNRPPI